MAHIIKEKGGLPGRIVSNIQFGSDGGVWATAYSFQGHGQKSVGLIRIDYQDIFRLFEDKS